MARHNAGDNRSFRSSLARSAAGGLVALIVTFGITGVLSVVGRDDGTGGPAMVAQPTEVPQRSESTPAAEPASPSASASPAAAEATPTSIPQETTEPDPDGVTVQVLDAVGSGTQADQAAAVLRDLGYTVVVVNPTPRRVKATTVLATPGSEEAAEALRDEDPRFGIVKRNNAFNRSVDLHVLVGPDFTSGDAG